MKKDEFYPGEKISVEVEMTVPKTTPLKSAVFSIISSISYDLPVAKRERHLTAIHEECLSRTPIQSVGVLDPRTTNRVLLKSSLPVKCPPTVKTEVFSHQVTLNLLLVDSNKEQLQVSKSITVLDKPDTGLYDPFYWESTASVCGFLCIPQGDMQLVAKVPSRVVKYGEQLPLQLTIGNRKCSRESGPISVRILTSITVPDEDDPAKEGEVTLTFHGPLLTQFRDSVPPKKDFDDYLDLAIDPQAAELRTPLPTFETDQIKVEHSILVTCDYATIKVPIHITT